VGCNSELRGMQKRLGDLERAGLRVVAISVDEPETSRDFSQQSGYTYTFLSDSSGEVARRYDLFDPAQEVSRPAEFLLDASGIVRWRNLTEDFYVRARPEQVLEAAKALR
jgi:mycoredoxin-dependent peroxiredoxin